MSFPRKFSSQAMSSNTEVNKRLVFDSFNTFSSFSDTEAPEYCNS